jgi:hypothetical protein
MDDGTSVRGSSILTSQQGFTPRHDPYQTSPSFRKGDQSKEKSTPKTKEFHQTPSSPHPNASPPTTSTTSTTIICPPRPPNIRKPLPIRPSKMPLTSPPRPGLPAIRIRRRPRLDPQIPQHRCIPFSPVAPVRAHPPPAGNHRRAHLLQPRHVQRVDLAPVDVHAGACAAGGVGGKRAATQSGTGCEETGAGPADCAVGAADGVIPGGLLVEHSGGGGG